jgi:hypothetical protein
MVPGDHHLRALADDVAAETDPRPASQLQPEAHRFPDGARDALRQSRRFQHDEQAAGSAGESRQPVQPIGDAGGPSAALQASGSDVVGAQARGQIDEEQVHGTALEERAGDAQPLVQRLRRQDDEPLQAHAARNGLHGIERARKIQVRDDRAAGLGLCREPEGEGGLAARRVAVHGDRRSPRHAARSQDRVQRREAGVDDAAVIDRRFLAEIRQRHGCQRTDDCRFLARVQRPRSCGPPASLEGRQRGTDLG